MKALLFSCFFFLSFFCTLQAQSVETVETDDVIYEEVVLSTDSVSTAQDSTPLLPNKYLFTQKILWGQKGLMRNFSYFDLNETGREREMEIRTYMLTAHRYLGYATLVGMLAEGIVGAKLYNGDRGLRDTHESLAAAVNVGYFTTAGLALFAPPRMTDRPAGFSKVKAHKILAIVHLSSMIATNILAGSLEGNPSLRPYHRAAAFTAFGSFFASMVIISI